MKKFSFAGYLLVLGLVTVICGLIYTSVQQSYRTGANDPQLQLAHDINLKIARGRSIENYFADTIDISQSLSPIVVLYDAEGKPVRSSGFLDGQMLKLPQGVFDYVRSHGEEVVTCQPQRGVRMAMVIVRSNSSQYGFIASRRSLQEVEIRTHGLTVMVGIAWLLCIGLVLIYAAVKYYFKL